MSYDRGRGRILRRFASYKKQPDNSVARRSISVSGGDLEYKATLNAFIAQATDETGLNFSVNQNG